MKNKRIDINLGLLYGGISNEREVSISTGKSIKENLESIKSIKVFSFDFKGNYDSLLDFIFSNNIDLIFNALHGGDGENGVMQSFLEKNNVKYTGSKARASEMAINKNLTKELCFKNNLPTPDWDYINFDNDEVDFDYIEKKYNDCCVIKPSHDGSSVGMFIIEKGLSKEKIKSCINKTRSISDQVIIEEYIKGRELTVSIIDGIALPIVEIIPKGSFYDYKSKYIKGQSEYIVPARLSLELEDEIQEYAESLYELVGCRHYARVDFILDKYDMIHILEINTLPGLTSTSLLPKAYAQEFDDFSDKAFKLLVLEIIKLALK